jgi:hypothetical protein
MSKVSIANRALALLGENKITAIDDETPGGRAVANVYSGSLRSILAECCWNFAKKRVMLNRLKEKPVWGKGNYFQLPADMVRLFKTTTNKYQIEGNKLLADTDEVGILYTYYNEDDTNYSPAFTDALVHRLAYDMCYDLTNAASKQEAILSVYTGHFLPTALSMNARDNTPDEVIDDYWVNQVRY